MIFTTVKRDYWPTREWRSADAAGAGMDPAKLAGLERALKLQYKNVNGIVIVRKGTIVFERYYHGCADSESHHIASVTKSVISALIGIAIDTGHIKSVEQKVLDFFPDFATGDTDIRKRTITIKHLLTMTAPFAWKNTGAKGSEPLNRLRMQRDWISYILELLGRNGQPGRFQYSSIGAHLLSAIITRATGMRAREFANKHLFRPTGMKEIPQRKMSSFTQDDMFGKNVTGWIHDPGGNSTGG